MYFGHVVFNSATCSQGRRPRRQRRGALEKRYNMLACHRGKPDEEIIDRVAGLNKFEQDFNGHARAIKYRRAAKDLRILRGSAP